MGDQGFRDARRHSPQGGRTSRTQAMERINHAHHRAEQADEGTDRGNGRQPGHPPFKVG